MQLLLSMNDFANFKQIGKGKDCVVYSASCEKLGGNSVVLKVRGGVVGAGTTVGTTPAELAACCTRPMVPRQQQQGSLCCQQPARRCMTRPRYQLSSTAASGGKRA
jgi:hypothetical protein